MNKKQNSLCQMESTDCGTDKWPDNGESMVFK